MDPVTILIFLVLFLLSAFFSGSETAFMSIPEHKIEALVRQKKFGSKELKKLKSNNDKLIITILIGNNLVNVFTASLATSIAISLSSNLGLAQSTAIGLSTGIITLLLLLFGEIFPKTLATRYVEHIALSVSKIYIYLQFILYPIIFVVNFFMKILQKKSAISAVTDEEIEAFIDMGKASGLFEKGEYEKLKNMLDFYEVTCEEIMTPRVKIDAINYMITVDDAVNKLFDFNHSRILVYKDDIDHIEWVVTLKELLSIQKKGMGNKILNQLSLSSVIKVPLTKPIHSLFDLFKKSRKHIAIVMDEYGGVAGLVSLEDVVEEVFGEIQDETDKEIDPIRSDGNGGYLFQSEVRIDDMLDKFNLEFDEVGLDEKEIGGEALSYFVISLLERFPKKGDKIKLDIRKEGHIKGNLCLNIESVDQNIIGDIKVGIHKK